MGEIAEINLINNFEIGSNFINFEENTFKTYHGGLCDIKYVPRAVKHVCHPNEEKHKPCLMEIQYLDFI